MKKQFAKFTALLLTAVMLTGCGTEESERPELLEPVNATLETAPVERGALSSMTLYNAEVVPDVVEISFDTDGYIYGIYVEAGEYVDEGDVVASIVGSGFYEIDSLEDEIEELEEECEDNYKYLAAELELARLNGEDTDELELKLEQEQELDALKLAQKKARLEALKADDPGYIYIIAPFDGQVVAASSARQGEFVAAGSAVAALEGSGAPRITCDFISEKTAGSLYDCYALIHGTRYEIEYDPYTKDELAELAANGITPLSVFNFKDRELDGIEIGDYAAVITVESYVDDVLMVPINAVYSDSSGKFVYEVNDNVRTKKTVVTGISDSVNIEIISGIEEGAYVYVKN